VPLPSRARQGAVKTLSCADARRRRVIDRLLRKLPPLSGAPVRIENAPGLRDRRGPVHAGCFPRERRIAFDCTAREFPRIFVHELFHFAWIRLGNRRRIAWERVLERERQEEARGELGWSAEWRKDALEAADVAERTRRWREYCCESFCDTAAWMWAGSGRHAEFTLAERWRGRRRTWFRRTLGGGVSI
jgi:hypothetical protein